jgi:hypothetical protein
MVHMVVPLDSTGPVITLGSRKFSCASSIQFSTPSQVTTVLIYIYTYFSLEIIYLF